MMRKKMMTMIPVTHNMTNKALWETATTAHNNMNNITTTTAPANATTTTTVTVTKPWVVPLITLSAVFDDRKNV